MAEIKIKTVEKDEDAIDFPSLENEVVKETKKIEIKNKKDEEEKKQFHPDKKLWTIFAIIAAVIVIGACAFAFWPVS